MRTTKQDRGFSLVEVLVGLFLIGIAVMGLAQLFLASVANNLKADRVANATQLRQQFDAVKSMLEKKIVEPLAKSLPKSICHFFTRKHTGDNTPQSW